MARKLGHGHGVAATPHGELSLRFSRVAVDDLIRLRAFISKNNPAAASRIGRLLLQSIDHLRRHPRIGYRLDDPSEVRQWIAGSYVVNYRLDDDTVVVLRIWHGREPH